MIKLKTTHDMGKREIELRRKINEASERCQNQFNVPLTIGMIKDHLQYSKDYEVQQFMMDRCGMWFSPDHKFVNAVIEELESEAKPKRGRPAKSEGSEPGGEEETSEKG